MQKKHTHNNSKYLHHQNPEVGANIKELVFGMEDGMVSTFGSITGIAAATQDPFTILLAGFVIISVESISMAVGSYLSNKSEQSIDKRMIEEEREEINKYLEEEVEELKHMYIEDGWPRELAETMAKTASKDKELLLKEMSYRELKIVPDSGANPAKGGIIMGVSYILGGLIPLLPYVLLPLGQAILLSIGVTLVGLFILGVYVTKYSGRSWLKSGLEMLVLAGLAGAIGFGVGQLMDNILQM